MQIKKDNIKRCTCEHEYQDKEHGKGMRVHNKTSAQPVTYRCTVCKTVR